MLVAAPVVRPQVNFSAIAGLETIILNVEPAVGVRDFLGAVTVLRQSPEFIRRTGAAILPLLDALPFPVPNPLSSRSRRLLTLTIRCQPSPTAMRFQCSLLARDTSLY